MSLSVGIVGLPNVGKSTLFNALTKQNVVAENYPFATIDPNVGVVAVPDERLEKLALQEHSEKIVPTIVEFIDIAGLVKDAHSGEGLGNKFLSHIREVDAIAEVVRFFEDPNVLHVEGKVDPGRDMETIKTELILADLATLKKRIEALRHDAKSGDKLILAKLQLFERLEKELSAGKLANQITLHTEEKEHSLELQLLTAKPFLLVANTEFDTTKKDYKSSAPSTLPIDAKLEMELAQLDDAERAEYLKELGLAESGLDRLIKAAYQTLGLITFLTTGQDETRAWTVRAGSSAPVAAGVIHTDFERGFIKAEVINWQKLLQAGSWNKAREVGWIRTEGKEYIMQDGDVVFFKFNV
ncbi:MAG: redox-regulated ATPase YchF [bacterium]|nr:redox-regulated ATPase YchF [bacterium]